GGLRYLRCKGEPTCQPISSTAKLRQPRFSAPVAWDYSRCTSERSSPIGAWPRSTSSTSAPTAAPKSGRRLRSPNDSIEAFASRQSVDDVNDDRHACAAINNLTPEVCSVPAS